MWLTLKTKKRLTSIAQCLFFLLSGIEYAVILPTLNLYLGHLDGDETFFGIVMSAFSFSGLIAAPLYGLFQDRFKKTKVLILFANLWEIGGNFLYFYGGSKYILLCGRLLSGIGFGVCSAIYGHISRTSTEKNRTAAISIVAAARQVGMLIGPAFNVPLNICNFYIGPFHVNNFSGPGILMCSLFIILEIIVIFCYYDIPPLNEQEKTDESGEKSNVSGNRNLPADTDARNHASQHDSKEVQGTGSDGAISNKAHPRKTNDTKAFSVLDVLLTEEVLVLMFAQFVFMFTESFLETALTVMTKRLLNFGGVANSLLYALVGMELLVSMIIIKFISRFVVDRSMYFSSLTIYTVPFILYLIFYPHATPGEGKNLAWFLPIFIPQVACWAFLYISIASLITKVTPVAMQGFAQGIRLMVGGVGTIMGPLWAGSVNNWPFETLSVLVAILFFLMGLSLLSWKRLKPHSEVVTGPHMEFTGNDSASDDYETQPLLVETDVSDYGLT